MKKQKLQVKRVMPLLASIALLSGPILLVTACDSSINRYNTSLPSDEQNKIILDFVGVNYNITAQSEFSAAITNPDVMKAVQKQIEGIMAQQEFFNFFTKKLGYSDDNANATFQAIKNKIGLNLLATKYFAALNSDTDFDGGVYSNNNIIFQTDNWFLNGTNKFNYGADSFYKDNDPNFYLGPTHLYDNLGDQTTLDKIIQIATYADDSKNYNSLMANANFNNNDTYTGPSTSAVTPPVLETSNPVTGPTQADLTKYQQKMERFQWLLRFRYSHYYTSQIEPQLNEDLFTMANILDTILKFSGTADKPNILIDPGTYADQLQSWSGNNWTSNYRYTWDYTTSPETAANDQTNWSNDPDPGPSAPNPNLIDGSGNINPYFIKKFTNGDRNLKNSIDPIFGGNGYMLKTDSRPYNNVLTSTETYAPLGWLKNSGAIPTNYWTQNNKSSFAYTAPIYFIDDILNLNFNWGQSKTQDGAKVINQQDPQNAQLIGTWTGQNTAAQSALSKFIRADGMSAADYTAKQNLKWDLFWQMLYNIATQNTDFPGTNGATNYKAAGKSLYPKYIKKENVFSSEFWAQISSNYS